MISIQQAVDFLLITLISIWLLAELIDNSDKHLITADLIDNSVF